MPKFGVILCDPPWSYNNRGLNGSSAKHYAGLRSRELSVLRPIELAKPDAVLILWSTWPMLKDAMGLMSDWGFYYITGLPWIKVTDLEQPFKPTYGTGFWVRGCSEPVLIGRIGKPKPSGEDFVGLLSESMRHSKKPEDIYQYAETLDGPYLEMFARERREGWYSWGNEVESDVVIPGSEGWS